MNINQLPTLCLQQIFKRLPVSQQVTNLLVCTLWEDIQRPIFRCQKSLTLQIGSFNVLDQSKFTTPSTGAVSILAVSRLNHSTTQWLTNTFANITSLELTFADDILFQLTHLAHQWGAQLITLKLFVGYLQPIGARCAFMRRIINCLNHADLPLLKHLTLHLGGPILGSIDLPILSQLETFRFYTTDSVHALWDSLVEYAVPNQTLRCVELPMMTNCVEKFCQLPADFRAKVINLSLDTFELLGFNIVDNLVDAFGSLTQLKIMVSLLFSCTYRELMSKLIPLTQLQFLALHIESLPHIEALPIEALHFESLEDEGVPPLHRWPQLPSVIRLELAYGNATHFDIFNYQLKWIFPRLSWFSFNFRQLYPYCNHCKILYSNRYKEAQIRAKCIDGLFDHVQEQFGDQLKEATVYW